MSILKNFSFVLKTESLSKIAETLIKSAFERLFCYFVQFLCSHVFHVLIPLSKMAETLINSSFFDKGIFHVLQDALQQQKGFHHFLLRAFFTVSNRLLFIFQPRYEFSAYF